MSFPEYPAYKDSGVEWLGSIPVSWAIGPLKREYQVTLGKMLQPESSSNADKLMPYLRAANIQWNGVDISDIKQMWFSPRDMSQLALKDGDLMVSEGGDVGRTCIWKGEISNCYFQNSVNRIRSKGMASTRFLYYWIQSIKEQGYIDVVCNKSTIAHFTAEKVEVIPVPIPSPVEQTSIVSFLDHETTKIDALIHQQVALIELLREKRLAVISDAVVRGIDPSVTFRDSGVDWLGQVPAHWAVYPISKISTKITNGFVGPTRDILVDGGVPYIQATHIKDGIVRFGNEYFVREQWSKGHAKSILKEGDVLIVQTGAGTGDVGLVRETENGFNCHALIIVAPDKKMLHGQYLRDVLVSAYGRAKLSSIQTGAMHPHLNCGEVKFVMVPLPPVAEQIQISEFIQQVTDEFDLLCLHAKRAIETLIERRVALVSAAVTGKIDVRGFVAPQQ